jgi:hypothetical protein
MNDFLQLLNQILQEENLAFNEKYELLNSPYWDSMSQLVLAAWIHQQTGKTVSQAEIQAAKTIGDLKALYVSKI